MIGPNLSEWAVRRRSLIVYFMIAAIVAGTLAFFQLGRNEDPAFTFRTMVVQAAWPGATLDDTVLQVTERIERRLQEVSGLDYLTSYTRPGITTIFVNLRGDTAADEVPDRWYDVRKKVGDIRHTLPSGVVGPGFNDDFGDVFGIIYGFTADGFTHRELRDYVEDARSRLLLVPDVSKIEIIGAQDEQVFLEFSSQRLAALGLDYPALVAALQAQNAVRPAGVLQTGDERLALRVSGAFDSELDILAVNFVVGDRVVRLGDVATVRRGYVDPPQPMFRVDGEPAIGIGIAMREGGDILALGRNISSAMAEIQAELPIGIEPHLVADQAVTVDLAINEFTTSLWQAILIIIAASFVALGVRPGAVVALSIPLTLAIVFPIMEFFDIDLQRISLGALIIALDPAGRRRHDHGRRHDPPPRRGRQHGGRRDLRLPHARGADADRHAGHHRGLRADRLRRQHGGRVHLLDLRGRGHRADRLLVRRGDVRAADRHDRAEGAQGAGRAGAWSRHAHVPGPPDRRDARALADDRGHHRRVRRGAVRHALRAAAVLSGFRPSRAGGRSDACRTTPRSMPARPRPSASMRCSRPTTTWSAGAPMSAVARSASTCRSTSSSQTTSSPRR